MATPRMELEMHFQIWDNENGWHFRVGPCPDGTDLVELKYFEDDSVEKDSLIFDYETARLLRDALTKLIQYKEGTSTTNHDTDNRTTL